MAPSPTQPPRRPLPPIPRGATPLPRPPVEAPQAIAVPRLPPINTSLGPLPPLRDHPHTYPLSRQEEIELGFWFQSSESGSAVGPQFRASPSDRQRSSTLDHNEAPSLAPLRSSATRLDRQNARRISPTRPHHSRFLAPPPQYCGPAQPLSAPMVRSESLPVLTYAELELVGGSRGWAQSWGRIAARSPAVHAQQDIPADFVNNDSPTDPSPVQRVPVDLADVEPPPAYTRFSGTPSPEFNPGFDDSYEDALFMGHSRIAPYGQPEASSLGTGSDNGDDEDPGSPTTPTLATYHRHRLPSSPTTPTGPPIRRLRSHCEVDATPYVRPARLSIEQDMNTDPCVDVRYSRAPRSAPPYPTHRPSMPPPGYLGATSHERSRGTSVPRLPAMWTQQY